MRLGHGWAIVELSVRSNRWSGGNDTQVAVTPSYVWRLARRAELLLGVPIGLTSSADHIGGVVKFTFDLGLALIKCLAGLFGDSFALVADGLRHLPSFMEVFVKSPRRPPQRRLTPRSCWRVYSGSNRE